MRAYERTRGIIRSPKLLWDVLLRGRYDFIFDQVPVSVQGMSLAKRWNLFKSGANLIHRRLQPWSMPIHMQFELTNYCNLRCPVCATGVKALKRPPLPMDADLFKRTIVDVGPYLLTACLWAWGEPLLHPHLSQILRAIQKYSIFTLLSTNGQNLDEERVIQTILDAPPTHLIVAIDGLTDTTNSQFRVGAKLEPILAGVHRLADLKHQRSQTLPILHMRFIVMKHNQSQVPQLQEFATRHGFDFLSYRTLSIIDYDKSLQTHRELVPDLVEFRAYGYENDERIKRSDFICQQPFWFPSLFADGTVVSCDQDYNAQKPFGVVKEDVSFTNLWYSQPAMQVRHLIRDKHASLSFCRNCPFWDRPTTPVSVKAMFLNPETPRTIIIAGSNGRGLG